MTRLSDLPEQISNLTIQAEDGCWLWTASSTGNGYGCIRWKGATRRVHRVVYGLVHGVDAMRGLDVHHRCGQRMCLNPQHLEAVTHRQNLLLAAPWDAPDSFANRQRNKTHCPSGHPYEGTNLYFDANGGRACRRCRNAAAKRWKTKKRLQALEDKSGQMANDG